MIPVHITPINLVIPNSITEEIPTLARFLFLILYLGGLIPLIVMATDFMSEATTMIKVKGIIDRAHQCMTGLMIIEIPVPGL